MSFQLKRIIIVALAAFILIGFSLAVFSNPSSVIESSSESQAGISVIESSEEASSTAEESDVDLSFVELSEPDISSVEESSDQPSIDISDISEEASETSVSVETSEESESERYFPTTYINNNTSAKYISVYNLTTGKYIYGKNENEKCYPASMTKLITSILAIRYLSVDEVITVGDEIKLIGKNSSVAGLKVGYEMKLEVLLDAMLLPSGNDAAYTAAVAIGRKIVGSEATVFNALEAFYDAANTFCSSLGCTGTHIACPDGYHNDNHYSTAADFILISKEAVKYDLILKVVQKVTAEDTLEDGKSITFKNTNQLIVDGYRYCSGLKTGTTDEAGYCMSVLAENDGEKILIVVGAATSAANRYSDVKKLISAAFGFFG